ncbi:hypothetical protein HNP84_000216 [Thermocatellispora tengchongensis]|uniref:HNH endonuclease n=1 Tax=Thermocatellispora tengchongensis TaxID=1073253 RepID=A0A840NSH8_9ACTN|nr:hypothetical protein [Thermocatellispora tengchongensis]MBB5130528.1 hypothetical protein [Thermocatellispora tengchongensis]
MPRSRHRAGRPYRRAREQMFQLYGDTCHICLHPGAGEADHLVPVSIDGAQPIDPHAMRPAHGANAPCPTCGRKCNTERGAGPVRTPDLGTSRDWYAGP